jgi:hypothetical protein
MPTIIPSAYQIERDCLRMFSHQANPAREIEQYQRWASEARTEKSRDYYNSMVETIEAAWRDHQADIEDQPFALEQLEKACLGLSYECGPMNHHEAHVMALSIYHHGGIERSQGFYLEDEPWHRLLDAVEAVLAGASKRVVDAGNDRRATKREQYEERMATPVNPSVAAELKWKAEQAEAELAAHLAKPDPRAELAQFSSHGIGGSGTGHKQINRMKAAVSNRIVKHEETTAYRRQRAVKARAAYEGYVAGTHHASGQKRRKSVAPMTAVSTTASH